MNITIKNYRKEKQTKLDVYFASQKNTLNRDTGRQRIEAKSKNIFVRNVVSTSRMTMDFIECVLLLIFTINPL